MCWGHYYDTTAVLLHLKATRPDSSRTGPNALLEVRRSFCPPVGVKTPKVYHPYLGVKISIRSIIRIPETLGAKTSDLPRLYGAKITAYLPILRVKKNDITQQTIGANSCVYLPIFGGQNNRLSPVHKELNPASNPHFLGAKTSGYPF